MTINTGTEYYRGKRGEYRSTLWNGYDLYIPADIEGETFMRILCKHNTVSAYLKRHPLVAKDFNLLENGKQQYFDVLSRAEEEGIV